MIKCVQGISQYQVYYVYAAANDIVYYRSRLSLIIGFLLMCLAVELLSAVMFYFII